MWTGVKKTWGALNGKLIKTNRKWMRAKIKGLRSVDAYSTHLEHQQPMSLLPLCQWSTFNSLVGSFLYDVFDKKTKKIDKNNCKRINNLMASWYPHPPFRPALVAYVCVYMMTTDGLVVGSVFDSVLFLIILLFLLFVNFLPISITL